MHHDILTLTRNKVVTRTETETYSILTCRCCKEKSEYVGEFSIDNLSHGWTAMSLNTRGNGRVFEWLLCPKCSDKVRIVAGLK